MSKPFIGSPIDWEQLSQKVIATVNGKITLTMSAGIRNIGEPIMSTIVKSNGDKWGWVSLNKGEVEWLLSKVKPGVRKSFNTTDSSGTVTRSLHVRYQKARKSHYLMLTGNRKDKKPTSVQIPGAWVTEFLDALSALLRRFKKAAPHMKKAANMLNDEASDSFSELETDSTDEEEDVEKEEKDTEVEDSDGDTDEEKDQDEEKDEESQSPAKKKQKLIADDLPIFK